MLEVFAVIGLCRLNRKNAIARGRRPGGYIALTIIFWILFEFIGAILGILLFGSDNNTFIINIYNMYQRYKNVKNFINTINSSNAVPNNLGINPSTLF